MTLEKLNGRTFDVLIVGAGPAGLFAALELCRTRGDISVCLVDKGQALGQRTRAEAAGARSDDWLQGFGGSGFFIGGRLSLDLGTPTGRPSNVPAERAIELSDAILDSLDGFHATSTLLEKPPEALKEAARRASAIGLTWQLNYPARHLDADNRVRALRAAESELVDAGTSVVTDGTVADIEQLDHGWSVVVRRGEERLRLLSSALLLAPGRGGAAWLESVMRGLGGTARLAASVGVRIESATSVLEPLTSLTPDPRLSLQRPSGLFRTYAFAAGGSVAVDSNGDVKRVTIKPAGRNRTTSTSFSVLWQPGGDCHGPELSEHREPTVTPLGKYISAAARDTSWEVAPTIQPGALELSPTANFAFGDVRPHWPHEYWYGLDDFLDRLEQLSPGIKAPRTLVYSPAIERQWTHEIDEYGLTELPGLYLAGDGAGVSQGAMGAAISGMAAGRGLVRSIGKSE